MRLRIPRQLACTAWLAVSLAAAGCGREPGERRRDAAGADSTLRARQRIVALEAQRNFGNGELQQDLRHPDARVRRAAAMALGRIQDAAALEPLLPLLSDPDSSVAQQAAFALGQLQGLDENGRHALQGALLAKLDITKRERAAPYVEVLAKQGGPETVSVLTDYLATGILAGMGSEARPPVVEGMAALGLARLHTAPALDALAALGNDLTNRDTPAAWRIAAALGAAPDRRFVTPLVSMLGHAHAFGRAAAARALGKQRDGVRLAPLVQHLSDLDWEVRASLLIALGELARHAPPDSQAADFCAALVADNHPLVREAAITALDSLGLGRRSHFVREALRDSTPAVRRVALRALARHEGSRALTDWRAARADRVEFVRVEALDVTHFVCGDELAADTLVARLADGPVRVRMQAASALGDLPHPSAATRRAISAALERALQDPDFVVAANAAEAIGKLQLLECAAALDEAYSRWNRTHNDVDVRLAAVDAAGALARAKHGEAAPLRTLLTRAGSDRDPRVVHAAQVGLATLAGKPEPAPLPPRAIAATARLDSLPAIDLGLVRVRVVTARGETILELDGDRFPRTVGNFLQLVDRGFYSHGVFHRVVPAFVVQGGCPRGDGWGDAGAYLPCEYGDLRYDDAGIVGMAHAGKDTGGSQFFITHLPVPRLDGRYTAFGRVVQGMDAVDKIVRGDTFRIERVEPVAKR